MVAQLELFVDSLPDVCRCANEKGVTLYRARPTAAQMRYIDPNHPNSVRWLVLDLDRADAGTAWMDANVPPPNVIAANPVNGHAHYFYALRTPVHWNPASSKKAQHYLAVVSVALTRALDADPAYGHGLAKNPTHPDWPTVEVRPGWYELNEMAAHLELPKRSTDLRRKVEPISYGRNCTMFNLTAKWAYRTIASPQGWFGYDFWLEAVLCRARAVNATFLVPLPDSEVRATSKSVARWVWERREQFGLPGNREWQEGTRRRSLKVRQAKARTKTEIVKAAQAANPGATVRELAAITGLPRNTVHRLRGRE